MKSDTRSIGLTTYSTASTVASLAARGARGSRSTAHAISNSLRNMAHRRPSFHLCVTSVDSLQGAPTLGAHVHSTWGHPIG